MLESVALGALNAIGSSLRTSQVQSAMAAPPAAAQRPGGAAAAFDSVMGQLANDAITALKTGEAASIAGLQGRASAQQVVEAMMSAERSLQLAISVRDKVVQAYQELTRMAI
jgi:flagellar hook-basal body complex protein FliE